MAQHVEINMWNFVAQHVEINMWNFFAEIKHAPLVLLINDADVDLRAEIGLISMHSIGRRRFSQGKRDNNLQEQLTESLGLGSLCRAR